MARSGLKKWAAIIAAIVAFASTAAAQPLTNWFGGAWFDPNNWFNWRNWSNGVPDGNTNAVVDHAGRPIPAQIDARAPAMTRDLTIGSGGNGEVDLLAGASLSVATTLTLGQAAGSSGKLTAANALMTMSNAIVGASGVGSVMTLGNSGWVVRGDLAVGLTGATADGAVLLRGRTVLSVGDAILIAAGPRSTGRLTLADAATARTRDLFIGFGVRSQGTLDLHDQSTLAITGTGTIWGSQGGARIPTSSIVLHGRNTTVIDLSKDQTAIVRVMGSGARLYGEGNYFIRVEYESDRDLGTFNGQPVSVAFPLGALKVGAAHNILWSLTPGNAGWGDRLVALEKARTLERQALPNTSFNVFWSAGARGFASDVSYQPLLWGSPEVSVPFNPADVTGNSVVSARNVVPRVSLMQFGQTLRTGNAQSPAEDYQGLIRNITSVVDPNRGMVMGKSENVQGNFDVAVMGNSVTPRHQIPAVRTLHEVYRLTGQGVRFGQIEDNTPYLEHGAFDDWSRPDGLRASVLGRADVDGHATRVASIMVGYDPLGIHVNGQSQFESADHRINGGFGYTGIAPKGTLVSTIDGGLPGQAGGALQTLVALPAATRPVVVNMSFGGKAGSAKGDTIDARMIDHYVAANGVIFTKSAGNHGVGSGGVTVYRSLSDPAGAYNVIVVGNAQFNDPSYPTDFTVGAASIHPSSSRGPTTDGRSAPHLVAQGTGNYMAYIMERYTNDGGNERIEIDPAFPIEGNRRLYSTQVRNHDPRGAGVVPEPIAPVSGTSPAAPTVAGVAGLMWERAERFGDDQVRQKARDPRTIKSILMTTAEKPATWTRGQPGVTPANDTTVPLSYDWGAGLLSPVNAMDLLDRGFKPSGLNNRHTGKGWGFDRVDAGMTSRIGGDDRQGIFYVLLTPQNGTPFTATLNWYRHVTGPDDPQPFAVSRMSDLDLELYAWDERRDVISLIARSNSTRDNHEHIYLKAAPRLDEGWKWVLRVASFGVAAGNPETFAVSWAYMAVPGPASLALLAAAGILLIGRRRR